MYDVLFKLTYLGLHSKGKEKITFKPRSEITKGLIYSAVFKWATRNGYRAFLKAEVKKHGNLSEAQFLNIV